ncbi:hypothetical protein [Paenibacillus agricola]|uniref:Uncharacterized protein n=1 Tax=Paenibacillus agricola TaxID=2716264 RepID=A0ABX0JC53_9BACL|nr:hypothetical protein [Paenibacillus agricola]NHN33533.1 hypothetical protein [Paenibacillus agricola]
MLKFTEKIGDIELVYEGETVQDILDLKRALNPDVLIAKGMTPEALAKIAADL